MELKSMLAVFGVCFALIGCSPAPSKTEQVRAAMADCQSAGVYSNSPAFSVCVDQVVEQTEANLNRQFYRRYWYWFGGISAALLLYDGIARALNEAAAAE